MENERKNCRYPVFNERINEAIIDGPEFPKLPITIDEGECENCGACLFAKYQAGKLIRGSRKVPNKCKELK